MSIMRATRKRTRRKVLYISGTRADYGLMRSTLKALSHSPHISLEIVATGMHLMQRYGMTIREIQKDKLRVHAVKAMYAKDDPASLTSFVGEFVKKLTQKMAVIKPEFILILGDRPEMLVAALLGAYHAIPVAHLHGGEVSSTVDESARHAITKLSHLHLPATQRSADRIKKMGEEDWRIHVVGAPGLDDILHTPLLSREQNFQKLGLKSGMKTAIVLYHPVTLTQRESGKEMSQVLGAIQESGFQVVVVYPNADPGNAAIINAIERYRSNKLFHTFKNIDHMLFLSLMKHADVMVGNSSSGIIEAPSFKLAVVNIGERQEGRERAQNVIDAGCTKQEIMDALKTAVSSPFKETLKYCTNPYGDGTAGEKIVNVLSTLPFNETLLKKRLTY